MTEVLTEPRSIRIKGRSFLAVVLSPDLPVDNWLERLDDLASRSAGFFLGRPVVLDVAELAISRDELKALIAELSSRNVSIMGLEGARPSMVERGMPPILKGGRPVSDVDVPKVEPESPPAEEKKKTGKATKASGKSDEIGETDSPQAMITAPQARSVVQSLLLREPVRSGQSVIFTEGDVTVIGSVASGAEIIAGGSIHIYGALRGRAMAGSVGNASARIFCRKMEAELLAIDGIYKMAEDMPPELLGKPVQLWLEDDVIKAEKMA
ncbi:septum site-determining protein MinC [Agrobacterium vitis]|uniref:Probable septum site-determining protein MinC n=2 Tax=Rhizobium/Agrobacterium group TaxID=227290 RepID=MINC_ALLAM|nr:MULTISPECIES: septum site-determining protein MinC [Rhizobium/Agrobacterium group]B9JRA7.1 RecName: Full=Probable septum site-determining protein MinC [Allorhizobium ampelinum S4]ACM37518.1 bacterial septum site-determining protein [Allorhizobium ampelinum S4]MCF1433678.1 septum site-determining protein MinC [Allorhizobium ampelinum]MCF1448463.1 septum site-determining protein MinC [Allorhizobium ampelinum]MUO30580.1 septum formation inhibitor MinC [Agrobacterium vitis]MUO43557.1 septum fo